MKSSGLKNLLNLLSKNICLQPIPKRTVMVGRGRKGGMEGGQTKVGRGGKVNGYGCTASGFEPN